MIIDQDKYNKENLKSAEFKAHIEGYESAIEDLERALYSYRKNNEESVPLLKQLGDQMAEDVIKYCREFLNEERDLYLMELVDRDSLYD